MQTEVFNKLFAELKKLPINSEARVVYIFVQIRKLLEYESDSHPIRFYCNWVVHTKLAANPAQSWLVSLSSLNDNQITRIISLKECRKLLRDYLKTKNLPDSLTNSDKNWISFHRHLVNILVDTPVIGTDSSISYLALERRSGQEVGGNERIEFKMVKDGKLSISNIYPF